MNKTINFQGLNCAACANKIEKKISDIPWIENANLNFTLNKINLKVSDNSKYSLGFLQKLVDDIESGVTLFDSKESNKTNTIFSNILLVRLILGIPLFILGLLISEETILKPIILFTAYILSGYDVLFRAIKNITKGKFFDEFFLMSIATIGAIIIGEMAEGVGVMIFFQLGEFIQGIAVGKSKKSIQALMEIKPDFARLKNGEIIQPEDVNVGDIIEVRPGEKIPLDGKVFYGTSSADTKTVTGESIPRDLKEGDTVLSGFVNITGIIQITVEKEFSESTVSLILDMVQNEASKKTKTENFITKFSKTYTPIVVICALVIGALGPVIIPSLTYSQSIYKSLIFLVISCPCALVISVPLGYFGGLGRSSKEGILIKGSNYIDALTEVTSFAFDKTGTLTEGIFSITELIAHKGVEKEELISCLTYTETKSNHPLAKAITKELKLEIPKTEYDYQEISGKGIKAEHNGDIFLAGNKELLKTHGIEIIDPNDRIGTRVYLSKNKTFLGQVILSDKIKMGVKNLIRDLGQENVHMLTGDDSSVANSVAAELDIKNYESELLPHDKANYIEKLSENEKVLFVGDGINDAPVLKRSHVGVSMGGIGSDAAIEASDVVLMTDEPTKIATGIKIAKYTKKVIKENIAIALGFKLIIMALGLAGITGLWMAVFADVGVTLIAVLNSLKALNFKA